MPAAIRPHDVATYIEELQAEVSAPSVKQQLAAIRMLFDWLVTGQVVPTNPAAAGARAEACRQDRQDAGARRRRMAQIAHIDPGHEFARPARPGIDRHADLQFRADRRGLEDEGRGSAAARCRMDGPAARERRQAAHACRAIMRWPRRCAPISTPPASPRIARAGCSAPRAGTTARTLSDKPMGQPDAWRMIRRRAVAAGIARRSAATRSARPGSPPISPMAARSSTRRKWRRMRARARRSFTTGRRNGSLRTRSSESGCERRHALRRGSSDGWSQRRPGGV